MTDLKTQLSALITALADDAHKVARTLAVDALEALDDLEHAAGCPDALTRARIRARILLLVYGQRATESEAQS